MRTAQVTVKRLGMFTRTRRTAEGAVPFSVGDKSIHLQDSRDWNAIVALRRRGGPPTAEDVRARLADVTDRIPALGHRVGGRRWNRYFEPCDVDLRHHVEELRFPAGRTLEQCMREAVERPWHPGRPPWSVQIISGYRADEHLLAYRVSHVLQDGIAISMTGKALFSGMGERLPFVPAQPPGDRLSGRALRVGLRLTSRFFLPSARWLPADEPGASEEWRRHTAVLDRSDFDDIGRRTGAGTAQICLAVLCGALRAWTPGHWTGALDRRQRRGLPAYLAMSLRAPRETNCLGNRVAGLPLTLPCTEPSPVRRLRRIAEQADYREVNDFRKLLTALYRAPNLLGWLFAHVVLAGEKPRPMVTIIPAVDLAEAGADELLAVPARPPKQTAGFLVTVGRTEITVHCLLRPFVGDAGRLPGLIAESLTELRTALIDQPEESAL
ncbi:wax ester/triacylglycerol synthase domain-containing protein [Streptomyces sp. L500]|uniref:wax ester/triacylglycerol synthase domain-containing protein n=1 Tax=Streptomyces abikoensis TaxID=97398 RepID=UPI00367ADBD7